MLESVGAAGAEYLLEIIVFGVGGALVAILRQWLKENYGLDVYDYLDKEVIEPVLKRQKKKVAKEVGNRLDAVTFKNETVDRAADAILMKYPKWLKDAGVKPDRVKDWLMDKYDDLFEDEGEENELDSPAADHTNDSTPASLGVGHGGDARAEKTPHPQNR